MKSKTFMTLSAAVAGSTLAATLVGAGVVSAASPTMERPVRFALTEEQRATLDQAKTLREEGKMDEAKALLESSGLFKKMPLPGKRMGFLKQHPPMFIAHREEVKTALTNNDFAAFKELTKDAPFADTLNEATFAKMVEAHKLMEAGNPEGARELMKEIMPKDVLLHDGGFKHGFRMRMHGATPTATP
jgi:hypothetical protein